MRAVALATLRRVEDGAHAPQAVSAALDRSGLEGADRRFVTELVYGTTRMRRACDWLVDRFLVTEPPPEVRAALRLGAYQLVHLGTPPHAAVAETVAAVPRWARGVVNAVLRKVASHDPDWPDEATRLSYPDWVVELLTRDLGEADALAALARMNEPATVTERPDGYVQDRASQWVAGVVDAQPGELVADVCAAPGGKATALAATGADVVAADVDAARAALVTANRDRLGARGVRVVVGDGRRPPLRPARFDRVLVDAPCSGLGVLRRRPDARWRLAPDAVPRLAALQRELLDAAVDLVRDAGVLVYSVCTMTAAETLEVDHWLAARHPHLVPLAPPGPPWRPHGRGALLLPHAAGTDGMVVVALRSGAAPR